MQLSFSAKLDIDKSTVFDDCYEDVFKLSKNYKKNLLKYSLITWMFVDSELAGEIYGLPASDEKIWLQDLDDDLDINYSKSIYCYSTTLLPKFQGQGLSRTLKTYWLGLVSSQYKYVIGHATTEPSIRLNRGFGAVFSNKIHKLWFNSERDAIGYKIKLGL